MWRRSGRRFAPAALSEKSQVLLHHWTYGGRCCCGLGAHVTGGKLLWLPEFTSGPHGTARSSPFGQLLEITTGGCRSVVADGEGQLPAMSRRSLDGDLWLELDAFRSFASSDVG